MEKLINIKSLIMFKILNFLIIIICLIILIHVFNIMVFAQNFSLFIDLKPFYLSLMSNGPGIGIGHEYFLFNHYTLYGKFVYMNFYENDIWLIYYLQGARFYFNKEYYDKFFIGFYVIILYGIAEGNKDIAFGIQCEIGYKWIIEGFNRFYIELQLGYIYFFKEMPILGISPGLSVGFIL